MDQQSKGQFDSNFGFLMASLGAAVGLGNLWSFPYKLGVGGGFAFLLIYAILLVAVGYPLVLSEVALGRKSQKAAIEAYYEVKPGFKFNGVLQTIVPFFTSGGSEAGETLEYLKPSAPGANWVAPKNLNQMDENKVKQWVETL